MTQLTEKFNEATIKKGDVFSINLPIGGFVGLWWEKPEIAEGKATQLPDLPGEEQKTGGCAGPFNATWRFKAESDEDIKIVMKNSMGKTCAFKLRVN